MSALLSLCAATPCRLGAPLVLFAVSLTGLLNPSRTDAVTSVDSPLEIEEAIRLAEASAPALAAREAAHRAAKARVGPAGERPDPELLIGLENLPVTGGDAFDLGRDEMTMRQIGVMQLLPRREKRELRRERAQADADKELALLASERLGTREAVARAWIATSNAEHRLALVATLKPQAESLVATATAAISGGRGSTDEAIAAQLALVALEDRIAMFRLERDRARIALAQWLPNDASRPLGPAPDWRQMPVNALANPERIVAHRELHAYQAMSHAAQTEIALARAEKRPDWSVELAYADRGPHLSSMLSLQFRVGLPLFAERRQDPLIAAREADLLQLESEREAMARKHLAELVETEATWQAALDRAARFERELLPLSNERIAATLAAYRGGSGAVQDVLNALDAAIEQRIAFVDVLEVLGQSWAALHFAFPEEP